MSQALRITFLGTAAGFPTKRRPHTTAIGLWRGSSLYLFDAGDGVAAQFAAMGIHPDALRAVFITHLHADHVGGLAMLVQWHQMNGRRARLPIYVPEQSLAGLKGYLHFVYLYPLTDFEIEFRPVSGGIAHREDSLEVTAVHSHHLEPGEPRRAEAGMRADSQAVSYLIAVDNKMIYISGDIASPDEAAKHAGGADFAIVELAHFTPEEVGAALAASRISRLVLTHIKDEYEAIEHEIPTRIQAAGFESKVIVATDGMEVEL